MPRRPVDVSDYDRERNGRPEHVRDYVQERQVKAASASPPAMLALARPHIAFERRPFQGGPMYQVAGLPQQVDTAEGFEQLVATLTEPVPGGGRYGGPGIVDFAVEGGENFGIRQGQVVRIPRPGLYDYDPRFSTVPEFREWLQREGRSGVITWRPYPEDKTFYEPYNVLFWFEGGAEQGAV